MEKKVKNIHRQLELIDFPYHIPLATEKNGFIIQKWCEGRSVLLEKKEERVAVIQCLQSLHATNEMINWSEQMLPRTHLVRKWQTRFDRFLLNEHRLKKYLGESFQTIAQKAYKGLTYTKEQMFQTEKGTLLHGDVVHHNFLKTKSGMMMIDFDLATFGNASDEMILWLHRALPNVQYDLDLLMSEHAYLSICLPKIGYLYYPNELLREWLYILQLDEQEQVPFLTYLLPFTKKALAFWPEFERQIARLS